MVPGLWGLEQLLDWANTGETFPWFLLCVCLHLALVCSRVSLPRGHGSLHDSVHSVPKVAIKHPLLCESKEWSVLGRVWPPPHPPSALDTDANAGRLSLGGGGGHGWVETRMPKRMDGGLIWRKPSESSPPSCFPPVPAETIRKCEKGAERC